MAPSRASQFIASYYRSFEEPDPDHELNLEIYPRFRNELESLGFTEGAGNELNEFTIIAETGNIHIFFEVSTVESEWQDCEKHVLEFFPKEWIASYSINS